MVATAGRFSCVKLLTCCDSTTPMHLLSYCRICSTGFMHGAHYLKWCGWCKGKSSSQCVSKIYHKLFWLSILNFLRLETFADRSTVPNKGKWMNIIRLFVPPNGRRPQKKKHGLRSVWREKNADAFEIHLQLQHSMWNWFQSNFGGSRLDLCQQQIVAKTINLLQNSWKLSGKIDRNIQTLRFWKLSGKKPLGVWHQRRFIQRLQTSVIQNKKWKC